MKCLWISTLALLLPLSAAGQANPDSVRARNDCRLAVQVVMTGHPAVKTEWAMGFVRQCSELPSALARAIRDTRTSRDTSVLKRVTAPADWLRDWGVYSAASEVLRDRTASPEARVFAIRVLMWAALPGMELDYSHLVDTDGDGSRSCGGMGPSLHGEIVRATPLPSGWEESGRALGRSVARDPSEPAPVREAARCLALAIPFPYARSMP